MSAIHLAFKGRTGGSFGEEVNREVAEYFASRGLSDKANALMVLKTVTTFGLMLVPYVVILVAQPALPDRKTHV